VNFRPELAARVMAGTKTVTRRQMSDNPRSPWFAGSCGIKVGQSYAVCPGRGKHAIGRVVVTDVRKAVLGDIDAHEAWLEGFADLLGFVTAWALINGGDFRSDERVWRVEFEVAA
jgi:hypothetical protein